LDLSSHDAGNGGFFVAEWPARLRDAALRPLPGAAAQKRFEPPWGFGRHYGPPSFDARPAAVLALLYPLDGRVVVALTRRHEGLTAHAGQISLPGGRIEPGESDWEAAVRELHEELGAADADVVPLAPLSPLFIFATNFVVRPWLAWSDRRPALIANPSEVVGVLETPLDKLRDRRAWSTRPMTIRGLPLDVPCLYDAEHCIWGATAMILSEVVSLYEAATAAEETNR
jgi:8-oxo-dGTP pyrophosphatase MutT (NUDIX family)